MVNLFCSILVKLICKAANGGCAWRWGLEHGNFFGEHLILLVKLRWGRKLRPHSWKFCVGVKALRGKMWVELVSICRSLVRDLNSVNVVCKNLSMLNK